MQTTQIAPSDNSLRLRSLAWLVQGMCVAGALVLASIPLSLAFAEDAAHALGLASHLGVFEAVPSGATRVRAALVSMLPAAAGLYVLLQLWRLFARYRQGDVFGAATAGIFARFAWGVVGLAVMQIVGRALMSVALSWDNPPGQRMLSLSIDWKDYVLLLLGAALVATARVMTQASRLNEENRGFV